MFYRRIHRHTGGLEIFIKDGKLFFKLYKQSQFTDKKDCAVLSDVTIEDAKRIHQRKQIAPQRRLLP